MLNQPSQLHFILDSMQHIKSRKSAAVLVFLMGYIEIYALIVHIEFVVLNL